MLYLTAALAVQNAGLVSLGFLRCRQHYFGALGKPGAFIFFVGIEI